MTVAGTLSANYPVVFEISRAVADAADTLPIDASLIGVTIIYNA
jgi:hypothetical protein